MAESKKDVIIGNATVERIAVGDWIAVMRGGSIQHTAVVYRVPKAADALPDEPDMLITPIGLVKVHDVLEVRRG